MKRPRAAADIEAICNSCVVQPSRILSHQDGVSVGSGLFALKNFKKGDEVALYEGLLIDSAEAQYLDPSYIVEFEKGRGMKLIGDAASGFKGIYANSVHPLDSNLKQNATFQVQNHVVLNNGSKVLRSGDRAYFPIVARQDIPAGEEIIVKYGVYYWKTLADHLTGPRTKPQSVQDRDNRLLARQQRPRR